MVEKKGPLQRDRVHGGQERQAAFTHGAWSELKTANSRRRIPIARELLRQLRLHRLRTPGELVFPGLEGKPIEYHNWRNRVWALGQLHARSVRRRCAGAA